MNIEQRIRKVEKALAAVPESPQARIQRAADELVYVARAFDITLDHKRAVQLIEYVADSDEIDIYQLFPNLPREVVTAKIAEVDRLLAEYERKH